MRSCRHVALLACAATVACAPPPSRAAAPRVADRFDTSRPLRDLGRSVRPDPMTPVSCPTEAPCTAPGDEGDDVAPRAVAGDPVPAQARAIEQVRQGRRPAVPLLASFDGLGVGFTGTNAPALRNPSDNSLAVGPDHIVQTVNSRLAVFTKRGARYDSTGVPLYGAVPTNVVFSGFGGACEQRLSGDAVVRYDQLAGRWLFVLPIFSRPPGDSTGPYSMCYAVSEGPDPLGSYHRYEFKRPLFPDYPRPAIWPDGYYVPTSTGDDVIQKHACVAERDRMLRGEPAREQCLIVDGVNFLNNADIDGPGLPPAGAPNVVLAAGGTQLKGDLDDDGLYAWQFHVDWADTTRTRLTGPVKLAVAPYHYLCGGQLSSCVPQPGTDRRLDSQGDKVMTRVVYRNINGHESIVATHSINTSAGGGGVRWYELRIAPDRSLRVAQQGTFAPDSAYRWMASIGMDRAGGIAMGYSFGGSPHFAGQRLVGRRRSDPPGQMGVRETVIVPGGAAQTTTLRWQDYTTLAMDPDDCRFWYVGDYLKPDATAYSTRIAAWQLPGCTPAGAQRRAVKTR